MNWIISEIQLRIQNAFTIILRIKQKCSAYTYTGTTKRMRSNESRNEKSIKNNSMLNFIDFLMKEMETKFMLSFMLIRRLLSAVISQTCLKTFACGSSKKKKKTLKVEDAINHAICVLALIMDRTLCTSRYSQMYL